MLPMRAELSFNIVGSSERGIEMNVINIDDYRAPKEIEGQPCTVTFLGFAFKTPEGVEGRLNLSITIDNGDFAGIIKTLKEQGGAYLPSEDGGKTHWFLPWPCAAVRICPVRT
jgi:hypothetical protein